MELIDILWHGNSHKGTHLLPYVITNSYLELLQSVNVIKLYKLSLDDIILNGYRVYRYINNELVLTNLNRVKYNKQHLYSYIDLDDYNKLQSNYFFIFNNRVILFTNILNHIGSLCYIILHQFATGNASTYNTLCKVFEYIPDNVIDLDYFNSVYTAISRKPHWFRYEIDKFINYDNEDNLKFIQKMLIHDLLYISKHSSPSNLSIDWWTIRGWSESYAIDKISLIQAINSNKLRKLVLSNPEKYNKMYLMKPEYWISKGYSKEEAVTKVKERQSTFSLLKCIELYGEDKGMKIFKERLDKWLHTLISKDDYIEIVHKRTKNGICASNISLELFNEIHKALISKNINVKEYYYSLNHEWGFGIKNYGGVLYDYVIPDLKYAIEFNGIRFHPNKDKLTPEEFNKWTNPWGETAENAYIKDQFKNNAIIKKGYILDIVWEDEYHINKDLIINNIVNKICELYAKTN